MGGMGANPFASLFNPATLNPSSQNPSNTTAQPASATSPSTNLANQNQQQQNPFAALFNPALFGNPGQTQVGAAPNNSGIQTLLENPEMVNQLMQAMGGGGGPNANAETGANANPYANFLNMFGGTEGGMPGIFGAPAPPVDTRPPEERYATQLGQLNQMGFHDFDRNIQALRRSGGDINGALEWLFSNPGS